MGLRGVDDARGLEGTHGRLRPDDVRLSRRRDRPRVRRSVPSSAGSPSRACCRPAAGRPARACGAAPTWPRANASSGRPTRCATGSARFRSRTFRTCTSVLKPLEQTSPDDQPALVVFFVNPDQLSALVVLADYERGSGDAVVARFGGACQSILFGYAEARRDRPRGVIGFFDIAQRRHVGRDVLSFTGAVLAVPGDGGQRRRQLPRDGGLAAAASPAGERLTRAAAGISCLGRDEPTCLSAPWPVPPRPSFPPNGRVW